MAGEINKSKRSQWFPEKLHIPTAMAFTNESPELPTIGDVVVIKGNSINDPIIPDKTNTFSFSTKEKEESPSHAFPKYLQNSMAGLLVGLSLLGTAGIFTSSYAVPPSQEPQTEQIISSSEPYIAAQENSFSKNTLEHTNAVKELPAVDPKIENPDSIKSGDKTNISKTKINTSTSKAPKVPESAPVEENKTVTRKYVFPVRGYPKDRVIQTHWGTGERGGTDLFGARGTTILSVSNGTVIRSGYNRTGGNSVLIRDEDGRFYYYAHLDKLPVVRKGQKVTAGQKIGVMGDSGNAKGTGTHLHIGIGESIRLGKSASGGCGINFDAVSFLQKILDES